jgi:hypothetical protein
VHAAPDGEADQTWSVVDKIPATQPRVGYIIQEGREPVRVRAG